MFWENFVRLCNEAGKPPSRVAAELGLAKPATVRWKKGAIPRDSTLCRMADYFGVSVESLTADDVPSASSSAPSVPSASSSVSLPAPSTPSVSLSAPSMPSALDESQLLTYYRNFSREGKGRLLDFAESMERSGKYAVGANHFA